MKENMKPIELKNKEKTLLYLYSRPTPNHLHIIKNEFKIDFIITLEE